VGKEQNHHLHKIFQFLRIIQPIESILDKCLEILFYALTNFICLGLKVCLYRTRPRTRLGGVREGMVQIKQTKVRLYRA